MKALIDSQDKKDFVIGCLGFCKQNSVMTHFSVPRLSILTYIAEVIIQ